MEERIRPLRRHMPIDRGWAWVICLATFGMFGFVIGSFKSQGVILVELQERFPDASAISLIWIFSLCNVIHCSTGLFAGFLLSKITHRTLAVISVLVSSVALISFGYSPSIGYMYAFFGVIYGVSSGCLVFTCLTAYIDYFDKRKALAIGITAAGSGVGCVCIPPLLRVLFDNFDFSSAILLFAGFTMQLLMLACLTRPISFYKNLDEQKFGTQSRVAQKAVPVTVLQETCIWSHEAETTCFNPDKISRGIRRHSETLSNPKLLSPEDSKDKLHVSTPTLLPTENKQNKSISNLFLFNSASRIPGSAILHQTAEQSQIHRRFDWKIALRKESALMGIGTLLFVCGFGVAFQCIPPLGKSSGLTKETVALVLAVVGAVETPSTIINGLLADRKIISAIAHLSLCMCITGVAALLCASISGLAGIVIMMLALSMCGSSTFSLLPIASGDLLGQENVASNVGINLFYQSVAMAISAFSSGGIYEALKRWEYVYYFIGGVMLSGGSINGCLAIYSSYGSRLTAKNGQ